MYIYGKLYNQIVYNKILTIMLLRFTNLTKTLCVIGIILSNVFIFKSFAQNSEIMKLKNLDIMELAGVCRTHPEYLSIIPSIFPFEDKTWVSSLYGTRTHPTNGIRKLHTGVDFACPKGSEIIATANGRVLKVEYGNTITGNSLTLSHFGGYTTFYGHLDSVAVLPNGLVASGDVVGISGESGEVTGPHLHYSIVKDGKSLDSLPYCFIARFALEDRGN